MAEDPYVPYILTMIFPGSLSPTTGIATWACPFTSGQIISTTLSLGRGSVPASTPVIVDILKGSGATPTFSSIYSAATPVYPQIPVGWTVGFPTVPVVKTIAQRDTLTASITQSGGGATPTDHDLTISIFLRVLM